MKAKVISKYVKKRDEAVIAAVRDNNPEPLRKMMQETGRPFTEEILWITAHKMCCNITTMPEELKDKSKEWLLTRGYNPCIFMWR